MEKTRGKKIKEMAGLKGSSEEGDGREKSCDLFTVWPCLGI